MRRVTFYTEKSNIFYLELAIDRTEFIRLHDFDASEVTDPDALMDQERGNQSAAASAADAAASAEDEAQDALLKSLGM